MDGETPATIEFLVDEDHVGNRLDATLARLFPEYSRTHLGKAIKDGHVRVNGQLRKGSFLLRLGQTVAGDVPALAPVGPVAEKIDLDVIFEDDDLIVINKPHGMVVHPAKGHWSGTLTSALAFHFQHLSEMGGPQRPGIVHRLDRDTSGVIIVAKHDEAHLNLTKQFEQRQVEKEYFAICRGALDRDRDWIRLPIGAHPYQREKMAVRSGHGTSRDAATFFEVIDRYKGHVSVRVFPKTGRTHQIRVHLAHQNCPVLCDPLYAGYRRLTKAEVLGRASAPDDEVLLNRLALHARRIKFAHPLKGHTVEFSAPVPESLSATTEFLQQLTAASAT